MPRVLHKLFLLADCHLCDLARTALVEAGLAVDEVDIGDDPDLEARYGTRIPVLRADGTGAELDWPFDAAAVRRFSAASRET